MSEIIYCEVESEVECRSEVKWGARVVSVCMGTMVTVIPKTAIYQY